MKLINAEAIIAALESFSDRAHGNQHYLNGIETAKELIAEADEAVVRCKDCRYYDYPFPDPKESDDADPERWCCLLGLGGAFGKDEFCSYGERRTDEAD